MIKVGSALLLCLALVGAGGAPTGGPEAACDKVLPAGQEAAIDEYLGDHTAGKDAGAFANPLDQALAVLAARAWPTPEPAALAEGAVAAMGEEFRRQGGPDISAEDRREWVATVARTRRFESVFEALQKLERRPLARPPLTQAALKGMLAKSGWNQAMLLGEQEKAAFKQLLAAREKPAEEQGRLGLRLDRWPRVEALPQSPAADAGIKTGDVVVKVNGRDVQAADAREAMGLLAGPAGKAVTLTVRRGDAQIEVRLQRAGAGALAVRSNLLDRDILYIQIPTLEGRGIGEKVARLLREEGGAKAAAILLDLRDDPGGRPEEADAVAGLFLDAKLLHLQAFRSGKRIGFRSPPGGIATPVVVLMNRSTGSAAEMLAMALKDNGRATLVGETSAGALFGKDLAELKEGYVILFRSEPTVLSPSGRDYAGRGIPPDIQCADKRQAGRDAVLETAKRFIDDHVRSRR